MQTSRIIILAALSASILLSCTKVVEEASSSQTDDPRERIITISYAGTRTALDGYGVTFEVKDEIMLYNGSASQVVTVSESPEGVQYLSTTLTGTLSAVYPAKYAVVSDKSLTYGVPSEQTGRFEDADICTATIAADGTSAVFTTQVSILRFYVDESIGVQSILVSSEEGEIADDSGTITVSLENSSYESLADQTDDPDGRICYVAVKPGNYSNGLTFSTETTTQSLWTNSTVTRSVSDVTLVGQCIYNAFIPYYIELNLGKDGIQRWGYCNIGAFLPEDHGYYFSWGNTTGYMYDDSDSNDIKWISYSFEDSRWAQVSIYDAGYVFNETYYDTTPCGETGEFIDAASSIWGDPWQLPTKSYVETLMSHFAFSIDGENFPGVVDIDGSNYAISENNATVVFPPTIYSDESPEDEEGMPGLFDDTNSFYWLKDTNDDDGCGYYMRFSPCAYTEGHVEISYNSYYNYLGMPIRPIFDASSLPGVDGISGTLDPMGKVYF